jgi:PPOX class probable F420-dependent enzyme
MARMKPDVLEAFLQRPIIAVLCTLRRDGRPYQIPVWFLYQSRERDATRGGAFWLTGTYPRVWCKHIFKDPRVSLCIEERDPVTRYVAVDCTAEPVEPKNADIWPISRVLAEKYVGSAGGDVDAFVANMRREPRLLFRLTPETWRAIDLTVYTGSRGDLAYAREQGMGDTD